MREFIERPQWHSQAVCRGVDPEIMFPGRGQPVRPIAEACPVRAACLAQAMHERAHQGVWGGASERHRRTLRRTGRIVMAHGDVATFDRATPPLTPESTTATEDGGELMNAFRPAAGLLTLGADDFRRASGRNS